MPKKPNVLIELPPRLYDQLFSKEAANELLQAADVTRNWEPRNWTSSVLASKIPGYHAVITGWGSPTFTTEVLDACDGLELIAHSAGTIKEVLPLAVFTHSITVTHAASAIAPAVAEMTLLLILLCLRKVHLLNQSLKTGDKWDTAKQIGIGKELAGQNVGVVGAGYTGQQVIKLLVACNANVSAYDPYLSEERARQLKVEQVAHLDGLFVKCPIVTMHAPSVRDTYHMVGARQLSLLSDGGIFINTARSSVVNSDALLAELRTGRIQAAVDVFDQEPLPIDNPFRHLPNAILTPHVAGASQQALLRQGQTIVDECRRFFNGQSLLYTITANMLDTMA
ncbi:MAG: Hydroxypyruvate reductase [Nitrosomonadaceae bacterium]|nr:Hydroxypyruvate reductase [Nitrosomonadaceae bacterium]